APAVFELRPDRAVFLEPHLDVVPADVLVGKADPFGEPWVRSPDVPAEVQDAGRVRPVLDVGDLVTQLVDLSRRRQDACREKQPRAHLGRRSGDIGLGEVLGELQEGAARRVYAVGFDAAYGGGIAQDQRPGKLDLLEL